MIGKILFLTAGCLLALFPFSARALTPEQVMQLKKAGVEDRTIRLMIEQEMAANQDPYATLGTKEIRDADGKKVVIYSTGRPGGTAIDQEEQEKLDRAWEMLRNILIEVR